MSAISTNERVADEIVVLNDTVSTSSKGVHEITVNCKHVGEISLLATEEEMISINVSGRVKLEPWSKPSLSVERKHEKITIKSEIEAIISAEDLKLEVRVPKRRLENIIVFGDNAGSFKCKGINTRWLTIWGYKGDITVESSVYAGRCKITNHEKSITMNGSFKNLEINNLRGDVIVNSAAKTDMHVEIWSESGNIDVTIEGIGSNQVTVESYQGKVDKALALMPKGCKISGRLSSSKGNIQYNLPG